MSRSIARRVFLGQLAAAPVVGWAAGARGDDPSKSKDSPNEKLNIAVVGTAGRAAGNIEGVQGENIVAICDIDDNKLGRAADRFPRAKTYNDFRKMLEQRDIDAVVVSTADHTHAIASLSAIALGKHVYCEKPLTHNVHEARLVAEAAAKAKVATQMGIQIHATNNYRRVVEYIRAGVIGPVKSCHVWCAKEWSGGERPKDTPPVPKHLHWDLWLGPAPERPYHSTYQPAEWRRWFDFGTGTLGDMACHLMDLPFWALDLDRPTKVSVQGPPVHPETTSSGLTVRYDFPARGDRPALELVWYDGPKRPPLLESAELPKWGMGILFEGEKGLLLADYDSRLLFPREKFQDFSPPAPTIEPSIGHHAEWIRACKTGSPTTCNFNYSGLLTESVLLGVAAYRLGQPIEWDAANLKARGCPEADRYLRREYRKGWELPV